METLTWTMPTNGPWLSCPAYADGHTVHCPGFHNRDPVLTYVLYGQTTDPVILLRVGGFESSDIVARVYPEKPCLSLTQT